MAEARRNISPICTFCNICNTLWDAPDSLSAVVLRRIEQFAGVRPAAVGLPKPGQHARQFGDTVVVVEAAHAAGFVAATAVDDQVDVGVGGDLRQVGDDDDLMGAGQPGQPPPDLHRGATAHPGVDLIEDHRGALGRGRKDDLQRQHDPGQLTAGRALAQRQYVGPAVRGEPELDSVDTVVAGVDRHTRRQRERRGVVRAGRDGWRPRR